MGQFVLITHEQIMELMAHYGRIDMLWLDGGWVRESNGENIRLGEVMEKAREIQPWLLTADRAVGGPYENLITPAQTVPERAMNVPWESCITGIQRPTHEVGCKTSVFCCAQLLNFINMVLPFL